MPATTEARGPSEDDRLTIIMPFFNAAPTIGRAVRSLKLIAPEHRAMVQLVAIDDGSTDDGAQLLQAAARELAGVRVTLLRQENAGSGPARNAGLQECSSGWVMFLDADDELACDPACVLRRAGGATAVACRISLVKGGRQVRAVPPGRLRRSRAMDVLTAKNPFHPASLLFRRDAVRVLFDPQLVFLEDWAFWIANPQIFECVERAPTVTSSRVHLHGTNKTSDRVQHGRYREAIARALLAERSGELTSRQSANLRMQCRIGRMQQGRGRSWKGLMDVRCDPALYAKFAAHLMLGRWVDRLDGYGRA